MFATFENSRYMQYFAAITASLMSAAASTYAIWPSPSLPMLQSEDSPIGKLISDEEGSWIVSLLIVAVIPGAFISGWTVEVIGRKKTLLLSGLSVIVPWLIIIFTKSVWLLYIARLIGGIGLGMSIITCTIYIGEIADNDIRGKLASTFTVLKYASSLLVLVIGPYVSYTVLAIICLLVPIIFICTFIFMPESPYYCMKINKIKDAEKNLQTLLSKQAKPEFITARLNEIENCVAEDMKNKTTIWEFFSNPDNRRPIIIITGVKTLQQLSGVAAIDAYMITIIELALGDNGISSDVSSLIFAVVQVPAVLVASFLVDRLGRKPLIMISSIGCAIALFLVGTFFYFQDVLKDDVSSIKWLPTLGIALYLIMSPIGIFTLPYILMGEIFATNIKGIAVSYGTIYGGTLGFLVSKFFKPLTNAWGIHTVFWLFGGMCILGLIFVIFVLPETKGKSFLEIQAIMKKSSRKNDNETKESY